MKVDPLRRQIVVEARRLIFEEREADYGRAIRAAARRLCGGRVLRSRLPSRRELHGEVLRAQVAHDDGARPDPIRVDPLYVPDELAGAIAPDEEEGLVGDDGSLVRDRFGLYRALLLPLGEIWLNPQTHPERDALSHSLQAYVLAREARHFDEELQLAALLHEVGRIIDPRDRTNAALEVLAGSITERTAWLIGFLEEAHQFRAQTLGSRARRRLLAHSDLESLEILADCDRRGRIFGTRVPDVDEALEEIRGLSRVLEEKGAWPPPPIQSLPEASCPE